MHPLLGLSALFVGIDAVVGLVVLVAAAIVGASGLAASATAFLIATVALGVVTAVLAVDDATPTRMTRW